MEASTNRWRTVEHGRKDAKSRIKRHIEIMERVQVYAMLRDTLFAYSEKLHSVDLEIFSIEMELDERTGASADPALLDEFNKAFPERLSASAALILAADYIEREIVGLRRIDLARGLVAEFRVAACSSEGRAELLRKWT